MDQTNFSKIAKVLEAAALAEIRQNFKDLHAELICDMNDQLTRLQSPLDSLETLMGIREVQKAHNLLDMGAVEVARINEQMSDIRTVLMMIVNDSSRATERIVGEIKPDAVELMLINASKDALQERAYMQLAELTSFDIRIEALK